jgi:hypothetical protein
MSLLFFDGFDGYDAAGDMTSYGSWNASPGAGIYTLVRTGTGKSVGLGSANSAIRYVFTTDQAGKTIFCGIAFRRDGNVSGITTVHPLFSLYSTASGEGSPQILVSVNGSNQIEIIRGSTVLATGATVLADATWYYIESKFLVANSGGTVQVKINQAVEVTYASGDTQEQATDSVLQIGVGCQASYSIPCYLDDFYALNSDGTVNNTYLGEQRCEIITPTSDSSVAWTRNTGATNFSAVDDAIGAPDDDTTYVSSSTSAQKDEYGLSDLTVISTVAGVKLVTRAEKDDANPLSLKTGVKSGATDQQVTHALGVGYANFIDIFETSDGVSTAFDATTVNSLLSTIEIP